MTSCAPFRALDLPGEPAHARTQSQSKQGFVMAARLVGDSFGSSLHFGADLPAEGCIPVLVFLENRGGEHSFEIRRETFSIVLENGERLQPMPPRDVIGSLHRSRAPAYLLLPLIVAPIYAVRQIDEYNFDLARSFAAKSLPESLRFEKGDPPLTRAIFFRDPRGSSRRSAELQSAALEAVVEIVGARPQEIASAADGKARKDPEKTVGALVNFTVALSREELP